MSDGQQPKRSAFDVLTAASQRRKDAAKPARGQQGEAKRPRLSSPAGESGLASCPVCGRPQPLLLLQGHVDACLQRPGSQASPRASQPGTQPTPAASRGAGRAQRTPLLPQSHGRQPVHSQTVTQPGSRLGTPQTPAAASQGTPAVEGKQASGNAFQHLMQQQRAQSAVHNFYLELTAERTWRWRWFVTEVRADAAFLAAVGAAMQGGKAAAPATRQQQQGSSGASPATQAAEAGPSAAPQPSWEGLPPVAWHATTQLAGSRLGGSTAAKVSVRLLTNAPPGAGGELGPAAAGGLASAKSLLQSALQKNVRRCRAESAVRCAAALLRLDATACLRRCAVICVEDALLHPGLPMLVWLAAATAKGYSLGRWQAARCLAIVHHMAHCPLRDRPPEAASGPAGLQLLEAAAELPAEAGALVRCLLLRAAHGGMAGDVRLLAAAAQTWAARFAGRLGGPPVPAAAASSPTDAWLAFLWGVTRQAHVQLADPDALLTEQPLGPLLRGDIPAAAVDFHVSNVLEALLREDAVAAAASTAGPDPEAALRRAMWQCSSGVSAKQNLPGQPPPRPPPPELAALWAVAAPHAERFAADHVSRRLA